MTRWQSSRPLSRLRPLRRGIRVGASLEARRADRGVRKARGWGAHCQPGQPGSRSDAADQGVDLVGRQEDQISRHHGLAEARHVDNRANAQMESQAPEHRPPPSGTEPQPERQGELDQERAVRHQIDQERRPGQPFQIELGELLIEQHVMHAGAVHPGRAAALDHARLKIDQADLHLQEAQAPRYDQGLGGRPPLPGRSARSSEKAAPLGQSIK